MALFYLILVVPMAIYWALALIPQGPWLVWLQRLVMLLLGFLWIGYFLGAPPVRTGDTATDGFAFLMLLIYTLSAVAGAATGRVGRQLARRVQVAPYPVIAFGVFVLIFAPLFALFGA